MGDDRLRDIMWFGIALTMLASLAFALQWWSDRERRDAFAAFAFLGGMFLLMGLSMPHFSWW